VNTGEVAYRILHGAKQSFNDGDDTASTSKCIKSGKNMKKWVVFTWQEHLGMYERLDEQVKEMMSTVARSDKFKGFIEDNWKSIFDGFADHLEEMLLETPFGDETESGEKEQEEEA